MAGDNHTARERRAEVLEGLRSSGVLVCPDTLPIAERHDDLMAAIRDHQVVIVAGETGSGKSTQLPKICLELGRGIDGLVGHTQPRRVAARTIAERVADELGVPLGDAVGYSVRFTDRVGDRTMVRVMTDGILLAEIQRDRLLRRYDTIIVDEAHERSLNIDFLLGYLHQLLPQRPDLKVIVTSATIDTERFSQHFHDAPVVHVSGRTYPVEVRYRPYGPRDDDADDDRDQVQAVVDAVDELGREGRGDVLVFLSGEREIHDTADALRRRTDVPLEVLPLYARLSAVEQHRIFQPSGGRRVVLSTNVAETSLTVPGVRYVVDAGTARISRYSHRLKVQRLPIEPVSQASADQRAGRCGRVAPGICIRLYSSDDFAAREPFTEPEILRTNLASVILQMTAIGLGDVSAFPFLDPPDQRAVRDGYALLEELGALEVQGDDRRLTPLGARLARLPLDPQLGRMVLEADRHGCTREVMVIAAALSIQDPRERPAEQRAAADELHRRFEVPGSDFLSYVKLWDHLREQQQQLSNSQFRRMCRTEFLHYLRVREWQDLFSQLRQVAGQVGIRQGSEAGHPDRVHQAVLSGLLGHIGMRDSAAPGGKNREYRGAHGSRFLLGRESVVAAALPKWVVAAELVETNRLWGRVAAAIRPEWAEQLGGHLVKRSYGDPWWDSQRAAAVCREQVTLYGLPVANRVIGYDRVDQREARAMFIRCALVEGDWSTHQKFWEHNRTFLVEAEALAHRMRRPGLVDPDAVFAFYNRRIGDDVVSSRHFDRWWRDVRPNQPRLLDMRLDDFTGGTGTDALHDFPTVWHHDGTDLAVTYRFEPGAIDDGATVHVPVAALHQVDGHGFDWGVPGFRAELVEALLRGLPKELRRELSPMNEVVRRVLDALPTDDITRQLVEVLADTVRTVTGVPVTATSFRPDAVPDQLRVTFSVDDDHGNSLGIDNSLTTLQRRFATATRRAVATAAPFDERTGITTWDVGDLPDVVEATRGGTVVRAYPALLDDGDAVSLRVFTGADLQAKVHRLGVRRLLVLAVPVGKRALEQHLTKDLRLAVARCGVGSVDDLGAAAVDAAAIAVLDAHGAAPRTADGFAALVAAARDDLPGRAADALRTAAEICAAANTVHDRLDRLVAPAVAASAADARAQLGRLVRTGFVASTGAGRLPDVLRYVRSIDHRLARVPEDTRRDTARMAEVLPLERRYTALLRRLPPEAVTPDVVDLGWQLEEVRVAVFAQTVGGTKGASVSKVSKALTRLGA